MDRGHEELTVPFFQVPCMLNSWTWLSLASEYLSLEMGACPCSKVVHVQGKLAHPWADKQKGTFDNLY